MTGEEVTELFKDWRSDAHSAGYLSPGHVALAINPDIEYYAFPLHLKDAGRKEVKDLAAAALIETYQKYFEVDETGKSNIFFVKESIKPKSNETIDLKIIFTIAVNRFLPAYSINEP